MTRDKYTIKFTKPVVSNKEGLQLSTPEIVASYIAGRLKTDVIADLGCGIGGQIIFFAKKCRKVYAVERNSEKIEYARKNCRLYDVRNVEFIQGDALSPKIKDEISDSNIIFSDPARPFTEKERTLENLEPPIMDIVKLYSDITQDMAFHAPPQMPQEKIVLDCEREYLSLNGQLNRLTLYTGSLKSCERSAVTLPGGHKLCSSNAPEIIKSHACEYVYEPEPSIMKAGLLNETARTISEMDKEIFLYESNNKRALLTSYAQVASPFFKDSYMVAGRVKDISQLKNTLKSMDANKAVLRFDIAPDNYWTVRTILEEGLSGTKTFHVFGFGKEFIICEKIKGQ